MTNDEDFERLPIVIKSNETNLFYKVKTQSDDKMMTLKYDTNWS